MGEIVWGFEVIERQEQQANVDQLLECLETGYGTVWVAHHHWGQFKRAYQYRTRGFKELGVKIHCSRLGLGTEMGP